MSQQCSKQRFNFVNKSPELEVVEPTACGVIQLHGEVGDVDPDGLSRLCRDHPEDVVPAGVAAGVAG